MSLNSPSIELTAPAKINLSLRVLGRRDDGFHAIETRMVPIPQVSDHVRVEWRPELTPGTVELCCDEPGVPNNESNLAVQAVRELEHDCEKVFPGMRITLVKNIPSGAGLGGGSSDAASVILALNELLELEFLLDKLANTASRVGSDVPFFVYGCPCDCTGRGEIVKPLEGVDVPGELPAILLVKPPFGVETPGAYKRWANSKEIPSVLYSSQESPVGSLVNDLERPVFEKFPFLSDLKMWLLARPEVTAALMSGSGATVFAVLNEAPRESLEADIRERFGEDVWIASPSG